MNDDLSGDVLPPEDAAAWLDGTPTRAQRIQFETSLEYREAVLLELRLVEALRSLPELAPRADFADRVMSSVTVPVPAVAASVAPLRRRMPVWASSRALAASLALAVGMGASVAWSVTHLATVKALSGALVDAAGHWASATSQLASGPLFDLPWLATLQSAVQQSPSTVGALSSAMAGLYLMGLLALRHLMVAPAPLLADGGRR